MSSSDSSSSSVAGVSIELCLPYTGWCQLTLLLLLLNGLSGTTSGGTTGSRGSGSGASRADVGQELLDILALKSL